MKFRLNNEEGTLKIYRSKKKGGQLQTVSTIFYKVESVSEVQIE